MRYEIHVKGKLPPEVSDTFEEFAVCEAPPQTIVVGEIGDQTELARVLAQTQSLGLAVLSLRALPQ